MKADVDRLLPIHKLMNFIETNQLEQFQESLKTLVETKSMELRFYRDSFVSRNSEKALPAIAHTNVGKAPVTVDKLLLTYIYHYGFSGLDFSFFITHAASVQKLITQYNDAEERLKEIYRQILQFECVTQCPVIATKY